MAAAISENDFDSWLSSKLLQLNRDTDIEVFVQYIRSILDSEPDDEERTESIKDFLSQITEDDLDKHCTEIISVYTEKQGQKRNTTDDGTSSFEAQMASAIEKAQTTKISSKPITVEDKERKKAKEAILKQYAQVSDGEITDDDVVEDGGDGLMQNVNTKSVVDRQLAEREKNKQDHEKKKQKDKEDREKQKQKTEDRKESEKKRTQKGERRR